MAMQPSSHAQIYAEGLDALRRGDFAQSLHCWERVVAEDGNDLAALRHLLFCHLKLKHHDEVVHLAPRGLAHGQRRTEFARLRAEAAYGKSDFPLAIRDAEMVLREHPDDVEMAQLLVSSAIFLPDLELAQKANDEALQRHPNHPIFQFVAAKLALQRGYLAIAAARIGSLLKDYPNEPEVQALAAELCALKGKIDDSRQYWETAIRLGGNTTKNLNSLGWLYFGEDRYNEALEQFSRSIALVPRQAEAYIGAGYCHFKTNNLVAARASCNEAIKHAPQDIRDWELLFCVAEASEDRLTATRALKEIQQLDPAGRTDSGKKAKAFFGTNKQSVR